jgi:kynurenine--oxoglutarate transaminase/cysteine-S-conjugate beta-lyase/glutamine--phenylpyruvate transaminase
LRYECCQEDFLSLKFNISSFPFAVFTCPTPIQEALARGLEEEMAYWDKGDFSKSYLKTGIVNELVQKRDLLAKYLNSAGFKPIIPDAGYFMIADFSHLSNKNCS